ncbi:rRNA maturation RNase YbeY [Candidatus Gottesmanbacteria bacterium RIFCSPLOWO2_01_FULL_39_12b]|uniref:rRNA maturation RNase YbeY n=1 Tax=Candidatus Gottesmanbacteria bacterium RIFCSPLOWO2_01_FULL_39_12b TaxID=1798388 RepID=A0A1F6AR92_9BACT|nr:MAG: rRNA maturation RNase YbeY [Candidatus Gottesmanbacteria bacterium RIFCSPLOWO2_01_FULL_39_12b]
MLNILIKTDSHYRVNRDRIRKIIENCILERKAKGKIEVSVSIIGDRMMRQLNYKYRNIDESTDVLSFPLSEETDKTQPFLDSPDSVLRLGDIVISYPQAVEEAIEENKLVDDKIDELVRHAMTHLFGNHHQ